MNPFNAPRDVYKRQILLVMRAVEKNFQFQRVEFLGKFFEVGFEFALDFFLRGGRLGLTQFNHDSEIGELPFGLEQGINLVAKGIRLINELLRLFAVVPEIVRRHQRIQFAETFLCAGEVKETSADA